MLINFYAGGCESSRLTDVTVTPRSLRAKGFFTSCHTDEHACDRLEKNSAWAFFLLTQRLLTELRDENNFAEES